MPEAFVPTLVDEEDAFVPTITEEKEAFVPEVAETVAFVPETDQTQEAFVPETTEDTTTVGDRPYPLKDAETDGVMVNLMSAMEVVDRPRASIASGIIEAIEQDEFDLAAIKSEMGVGIKGDDHPMMGEYLAAKIDHVRDNPEEFPITSPVLKVIDEVLSLPYAGYKAISNKMDEDNFKLAAFTALVTCNGDKECQQERLKEVVEPLRNLTKGSIAKRKDQSLTTGVAFGAGFILDVAIDPVTYTNPILKMTKAGLRLAIPDVVMTKMVEQTGKTKAQIKKSFLSTNTGQSLAEASDFVWTLFSTKHDLKKLGVEGSRAYDLASKFKNLIAAARVKAVRDNVELQKRIKQFSVETGADVTDINKFITEAVERGGIPNVDYRNLSKETIELLSKNDGIRYEIWSLAEKNKAQLKAEINAGVKLTPMREQPLITAEGDPTLYLQYMNHAIRPEALNAAKKIQISESGGRSLSAFFNSKHSSTFKRREDWLGLTINDINKLAKEGKLPGYENQVFKDGFFYDDPAIIQALRDNKHNRSLAATELAGDVIGPTGFGVSPEELVKLAKDAGWQPTKTSKKLTSNEALKYLKEHDPKEWNAWEITSNKYTADWALPSDVAKFVDDNLLYLNDPKKVNMFLNQYDDLTRWWKSWTLSIFPSYHIRNAVGNTWNNYVSGVDLSMYKQALKAQTGIAKNTQGHIIIQGKEVSYNQLRDWVDEFGVTGRGLFTTDIETSLITEMGEGKWLTLSSKNKAIEIGKRVGEAVEDNARFANFIDGLNKGLSPEDAAKRVRKTLFDYSDLTEFEQTVMKRIFPFYTWTRKNVPFQLEQMVKHPGKYKAIDTLRQEVEAATSESDDDEKYLSEWMLANYPTKVGVNDNGEAEYFLLGGWWAGADLWKLGSQPTKLVTDLLHPVLKIGLEMFTGSTDEKGYVTDLFSGQKLHPEMKTGYLFGTTSETTKHYLNNLRVLSTIDEFARAYYAETGQGPKKISPFVKDPKTIEEALVSFFTGVRIFSTDLENQKLFWMKGEEKKSNLYKELVSKSIKGGRPQSEVEDLIGKSIEPIKKMQGFRRGGLATQVERLGFSLGGNVSAGEEQRLIDKADSTDDFDNLLPVTEGTYVEEPTMLDKMSTDWTARLESMDESRKDREAGDISLTRSTVNTAGALAGYGFDVAGTIVEESVNTYLDNLKSVAPTTYADTSKKVTEAKEWALNTDAGKVAVEAAQEGYEAYSVWKEANPQDAKTFEAVVNIGMFGWGAKGIAQQVGKNFRRAEVATDILDGTDNVTQAALPKLDDIASKEPLKRPALPAPKKETMYVYSSSTSGKRKDIDPSKWNTATMGKADYSFIDEAEANSWAGNYLIKKEVPSDIIEKSINWGDGGQSAFVTQAFKNIKEETKLDVDLEDGGLDVYLGLVENLGEDKAREVLIKHGIKGNRNKGELAVFNPDDIKVISTERKTYNTLKDNGTVLPATKDISKPKPLVPTNPDFYDSLKNDISYSSAMDREIAEAAHTFRGLAVGTRADTSMPEERIESSIVMADLVGADVVNTVVLSEFIEKGQRLRQLKTTEKRTPEEDIEFNELIKYGANVPGREFDRFLSQSKLDTPAPMYVIRTDGKYAESDNFDDSLKSFRVLEGINDKGTLNFIKEWMDDSPDKDTSVLLIPKGTQVIHTLGNADGPEVLIRNENLHSSTDVTQDIRDGVKVADIDLLKALKDELAESGGFKYKLPGLLYENSMLSKKDSFKPAHWNNTIQGWVKNGKIKKEELDDLGILAWLDARDNTKLSSIDILKFMRQKSPMLKTLTGTQGTDGVDPISLKQTELDTAAHNSLVEVDRFITADTLKQAVPELSDAILMGTVYPGTIKDILRVAMNDTYVTATSSIWVKTADPDKHLAPLNAMLDPNKTVSENTELIVADGRFERYYSDLSLTGRTELFRSYVLGDISSDINKMTAKIGDHQKEIKRLIKKNIDNPNDETQADIASRIEFLTLKKDSLTAKKSTRVKLSESYDTIIERDGHSYFNASQLARAKAKRGGEVDATAWGSHHLPEHRNRPSFTILSQSKVGKDNKAIYGGDDNQYAGNSGPEYGRMNSLYSKAHNLIGTTSSAFVNIEKRVKNAKQLVIDRKGDLAASITSSQKVEGRTDADGTVEQNYEHIEWVKEELARAEVLVDKSTSELKEASDTAMDAITSFEGKTGISYNKFQERNKNLHTKIYQEPHWTDGIYRDTTTVKTGISDENVSQHIRGVYIDDLESMPGVQGMFVSEAQAQGAQKAKGYSNHIKKVNKILEGKGSDYRFNDISGYAKKGTGAEADKLREKLSNRVGDSDLDSFVSDNHYGQQAQVNLALAVTDDTLSADTLVDMNRLLEISGTLDSRPNKKSSIIPESITHKKDWTTLSLKQTIMKAVQEDKEYLVYPADKEVIDVIEQWGGRDMDIAQTIADRNTTYIPRAFSKLIKDVAKKAGIKLDSAVAYSDKYTPVDKDVSPDTYNVIVLPLSKEFRDAIKEQGINAYRRGGLVTQMKALTRGA